MVTHTHAHTHLDTFGFSVAIITLCHAKSRLVMIVHSWRFYLQLALSVKSRET
jgi:hypothetical protein